LTFKQSWEKTDLQIQLPTKSINAMLKMAFPHKEISSYQLIYGGCANLNYKVQVKGSDDEVPYLLRIYLRDSDASFREKNLAILLKQTVPIPSIYFIDEYRHYHFGIAQHISGITLRDLLLGSELYDLQTLMFDVGVMLARLQNHRFLKSGFFNSDLKVIKPVSESDLVAFATECMQHENAINVLQPNLLDRIRYYLSTSKHCLPNEKESLLVHGDFDPANILVERQNGQWCITGIFDWEFSFSGSPLWDIANMLRYAHEMPATFEDCFIHGLKTGYNLPPNWHISINLLNLLSLLDCLVRSSIKNEPNRCQDIRALIVRIITQLESYHE
tara:strand:- start:8277 stop:9266 length:990 start_codon:yes stop_codon:yes gene_type:complete